MAKKLYKGRELMRPTHKPLHKPLRKKRETSATRHIK